MRPDRLMRDGEPVRLDDWIDEDGPTPGLEALATHAPKWRQWLGPLLSFAIVGAVLLKIGGIDFARIAGMLPANPLFWMAFAAAYMAQPATEWLIFRRLWNLPAAAILPLMRKQVGNEILLGYIGEVYFYGWARRHADLVAAPFGAIKDVTILSAMLGNLTTVAALIIGWPLLAELPQGLHVQALSGSIGVVVVTSLVVMLFRHKLFSLPRRDLWFVSAMHLMRILGFTVLSAAMWHLLVPSVALSSWVMLATLRLLVSRLPLIPNKELVFAGLALFLIGRNASAADAMALMAGLFLATHLIVGVALGVGELVGTARKAATAVKIVDVCAFYAPRGGGVKTYVDRKLAAGAAYGHEIVVVAPGEEYRTEVRGEGARIEWVPAPRMPFDRNYRYFPDQETIHAALDRLRPDFVEASSPWRAAEAVASWRGSAPRALFMHADPLAAYAYRWFGPVASREAIDKGFDWFWRHLRRLDARYDLVVSPSRSLAGRLADGGLRHVVTNPLGIALGEFSPAHRDAGLRAELLRRCNLGPDATLLVGLGRHAPEKRWPMIVDACMAAGVERPVGLMLIGGGRDKAKLVRHVGGNPHVLLLAPVTDRPALARLLASGDALIHGCEAETFCLVAAEARASGLPLIAPDLGGAADQARDSGGEVYRAADAASAAQAVVRLIDRGVAHLGAEARATAGRTRRLDAHFAELFAGYEAIAGGARVAA